MTNHERAQAVEKALRRVNDHVAQAVLAAQTECADSATSAEDIDRLVAEVALSAVALTFLLQRQIDRPAMSRFAEKFGESAAAFLLQTRLMYEAVCAGRPN